MTSGVHGSAEVVSDLDRNLESYIGIEVRGPTSRLPWWHSTNRFGCLGKAGVDVETENVGVGCGSRTATAS